MVSDNKERKKGYVRKPRFLLPGGTNRKYIPSREISKLYNTNISREEMEAYYFTHPELNYKLLLNDLTISQADLASKGLICYENKKWVYYYTFISGNVAKKISNMNKDRDAIIEKIGQDQFDRQVQMLEAVKPKKKGFAGDDRIIPFTAL